MVKCFETLQTTLDAKMELLQIKLFEEINILPILIDNCIKI